MSRHDDHWREGGSRDHRGDDDQRRDDRRRVDTGDELIHDLGRIGVELARGLSAHVLAKVEAAQQGQVDQHLRSRRSKIERQLDRKRERIERKLARHQLRQEQRYAGTSRAEAVAFAALAVAFFVFAAVRHDLWWLVFVGLAMGLRSAALFGYHARKDVESERESARRDEEERASRDPRLVRVDDTCDKLVAALKDAPENVRAFLSRPEETVEALRRTSHELVARESALRGLANPEDEARLGTERDELASRVARETDPVTRERLQKALDALDDRRRGTEEIRRQASRLDAEHTRLSYTLEGLYAQVLRMKTAGSTDAGEGLKKSLDQLRAEVGALADALEATGREGVRLENASAPESFGDPTRPPTTRVRD